MIKQEFKEVDGIKVFHGSTKENQIDYNARGLDELFSQEESHFWFVARKEFIYQQMNQHIVKHSKVIEIGAGTGNVSRYLKKNGYSNVSVGEIHLNGLKYAKNYGINQCYQFDLLKTPFKNEFDTVCMFDVLEHIADDDLALQNNNETLNAGGSIVLTVPAHKWLWSRIDTVSGHKIRYTKKQLISKLEKNGFEVVLARYFFIGIIPLLYLRTFFDKDDGSKVSQKERNNIDISMNKFLSNILLFISRVDNKLNQFVPNMFGGSLFVIAKKK